MIEDPKNLNPEELVRWPESIWPITPSILNSLPPRLLPSIDKLQKITYPWELLELIMETLHEKIKGQEIAEGVIVPDLVDIRGDVLIEEGVKIYPFTEIVGPIYIGRSCTVGNYSQLRECIIGSGTLIGERTSIARSLIGSDASFHMNYIGDSLIGNSVDMGGGVKTANLRLDRATVKSKVRNEKVDTLMPKLGIIVGDNVKFGADCLTMPGVKIGTGSRIGPKVMLSGDIPDNTLVKWTQQLHKELISL